MPSGSSASDGERAANSIGPLGTATSVVVHLSFQGQPADTRMTERRIELNPYHRFAEIGRSSTRLADHDAAIDNALIDSPVISRVHAELEGNFDTRAVYITDKRSRHGTFLNHKRLTPNEPAIITSGDVVKFGVDIQREDQAHPPPCAMVDVEFQEGLPFGTQAGSRDHSNAFQVPDGSDSDEQSSDDEDTDGKAVRESAHAFARALASQGRAPKISEVSIQEDIYDADDDVQFIEKRTVSKEPIVIDDEVVFPAVPKSQNGTGNPIVIDLVGGIEEKHDHQPSPRSAPCNEADALPVLADNVAESDIAEASQQLNASDADETFWPPASTPPEPGEVSCDESLADETAKTLAHAKEHAVAKEGRMFTFWDTDESGLAGDLESGAESEAESEANSNADTDLESDLENSSAGDPMEFESRFATQILADSDLESDDESDDESFMDSDEERELQEAFTEDELGLSDNEGMESDEYDPGSDDDERGLEDHEMTSEPGDGKQLSSPQTNNSLEFDHKNPSDHCVIYPSANSPATPQATLREDGIPRPHVPRHFAPAHLFYSSSPSRSDSEAKALPALASILNPSTPQVMRLPSLSQLPLGDEWSRSRPRLPISTSSMNLPEMPRSPLPPPVTVMSTMNHVDSQSRVDPVAEASRPQRDTSNLHAAQNGLPFTGLEGPHPSDDKEIIPTIEDGMSSEPQATISRSSLTRAVEPTENQGAVASQSSQEVFPSLSGREGAIECALSVSGDKFLSSVPEQPTQDLRRSPELDMTSAYQFRQSKMTVESSRPSQLKEQDEANGEETVTPPAPSNSLKRKLDGLTPVTFEELVDAFDTAESVSDQEPGPNKMATSQSATESENAVTKTDASALPTTHVTSADGERPSKRSRLKEAVTYGLLGGVTVFSTLVLTAPALT